MVTDVCNAVLDSCASDELWLRMCAMLCRTKNVHLLMSASLNASNADIHSEFV